MPDIHAVTDHGRRPHDASSLTRRSFLGSLAALAAAPPMLLARPDWRPARRAGLRFRCGPGTT